MTSIVLVTSDDKLRSFADEWLPDGLNVFVRNAAPVTAEVVNTVVASGSTIAVLGPDLPERVLIDVVKTLQTSRPEIDCVAYRNPVAQFLVKGIHAGLRDVIGPRDGVSGLTNSLVALSEAADLRRANLTADVEPVSRGSIVSVIGPKGGVGKTTLAVNLAYSLAQYAANEVVLVDLDLVCGGIADALQLEPVSDVVAVSQGRIYEDPTALKLSLTTHSSGMLILPAPSILSHAEHLQAEDLTALLRHLSTHFAHIVIDSGPGSTDAALAAAVEADHLFVVVTPEIGGLNVLSRHLNGYDAIGLTAVGRHLVFNKDDPRAGITVEEAESALSERMSFIIPAEQQIVVTSNHGIPYLETKPRGPVAEAFESMLAVLQDEQTVGGTEEPKRWFR